MIAHLFNAPLGEAETAVGVGTVGSSEAIMLAGLAFKRKWQNKRKAEGKPYDKPNIVTGANVQVHVIIDIYMYIDIRDHIHHRMFDLKISYGAPHQTCLHFHAPLGPVFICNCFM